MKCAEGLQPVVANVKDGLAVNKSAAAAVEMHSSH